MTRFDGMLQSASPRADFAKTVKGFIASFGFWRAGHGPLRSEDFDNLVTPTSTLELVWYLSLIYNF